MPSIETLFVLSPPYPIELKTRSYAPSAGISTLKVSSSPLSENFPTIFPPDAEASEILSSVPERLASSASYFIVSAALAVKAAECNIQAKAAVSAIILFLKIMNLYLRISNIGQVLMFKSYHTPRLNAMNSVYSSFNRQQHNFNPLLFLSFIALRKEILIWIIMNFAAIWSSAARSWD